MPRDHTPQHATNVDLFCQLGGREVIVHRPSGRAYSVTYDGRLFHVRDCADHATTDWHSLVGVRGFLRLH